MDEASQTGSDRVRIGVAELAGPWRGTIAGASACEVAFPSHVPEIFATLVPDAPDLGTLMEGLTGYLDGGGSLILTHEVRPETVSALPDLVRFVDDHLRGVDGIRYRCGDDLSPDELEAIQPWWQSALSASTAREVGVLVADDAWLPAPDDAGLRPPESEPPDVEPENVWVFPLGPDATDAELISAVEDVSLPRYINPARIDLPEAEVEAHCLQEPRDADRIGRAYRPNPWVAVNVGLIDPSRADDAGLPRIGLIHAVLTRCVIRRVLPHVV
ncbi:MAG: hypothetical protein VX938_07360, partial [Myxococcota bacterium]|nr:hypothetical protein [Myxococcota bacterium]